jgi:carbonic anhydrase/acetyltransferase-like protein (isoleucine patch superfamily)
VRLSLLLVSLLCRESVFSRRAVFSSSCSLSLSRRANNQPTAQNKQTNKQTNEQTFLVINAAALKELLTDKMPTANDFGNEVIPGAKDAGYKVQAYAFQGYWEDIGTIEAFYKANLALVDPHKPNFSFYDREAPIYTMSRFLPPSKIVDAEISNCIIGDGSLIKAGSKVTRSVVGLRSLINEDCTIAETMLMGSDYYETLDECEFVPGCLPMGVGAVRESEKRESERERASFCFPSTFSSMFQPALQLLTLSAPPPKTNTKTNHPNPIKTNQQINRARPCAAPSSTRTRASARAAPSSTRTRCRRPTGRRTGS